jgi:predicted MarR family transcription regulator
MQLVSNVCVVVVKMTKDRNKKMQDFSFALYVYNVIFISYSAC